MLSLLNLVSVLYISYSIYSLLWTLMQLTFQENKTEIKTFVSSYVRRVEMQVIMHRDQRADTCFDLKAYRR